MRTIRISDRTMGEAASFAGHELSFREKLEMAKLLDLLGLDAIETGKLNCDKKDSLLLKSLAMAVNSAVLAVDVPVGDPDGLSALWASLSNAKHPRLMVRMPVSPVGMEYSLGVKAAAMPELVKSTVAACRELCEDVVFVAEDAGRCERTFLAELIAAAVEAGAGLICYCDSAGTMLPEEMAAEIGCVKSLLPEGVSLAVSASNAAYMADACMLSALRAGADWATVCSCGSTCASLDKLMAVLRVRGDDLGLACHVRSTELQRSLGAIKRICCADRSSSSPFDSGVRPSEDGWQLSSRDDMHAVCEAAARMGYELSEEDAGRVFEAFSGIASRKDYVSARELDAIIASAAMQVPPSYELESFVINSGNVIHSTACIQLRKNGQVRKGFCLGDGPIDAAFLAIEQIVGCHYELDDFQIQAVTEGREAMGETVVRLRSQGKLYSGRGISTDIIGSSIHAYINALNKIVYEEEGA